MKFSPAPLQLNLLAALLFHDGKEACPLCACLKELGHSQPPTLIQTDNRTAAGIANDSVKQKCSEAIDMHFYWIRDRRVRQGQFFVYWRKGSLNKADYFTKHHPARPRIIKPFTPSNINTRQAIAPKNISNVYKNADDVDTTLVCRTSLAMTSPDVPKPFAVRVC
jgi:hypothetical protein